MALRESRIKVKIRIQPPLFIFVILVVISGVLLAASTGGFVVNFKNVGFTALSSFQRGIHTVTTKFTDMVSAVKRMAELQEEYDKLLKQLENYQFLQQTNTEIRRENELLKEQLGFTESFEYVNYPARIIGRDPNNQYSLLTLNMGSKQGIKKNMPVIAIQNGTVGLVGKVLQVGYNTCMVMPVYDYSCNVSGRIQKTRDIGLVNGLGWEDSPLIMRYIKKRVLDKLQYGDLVVTSGENDNFMKDIPIGYISKITTQDYDSSLIIELTPVLDFNSLENVIVVDVKNLKDQEEEQ